LVVWTLLNIHIFTGQNTTLKAKCVAMFNSK
jgi:hypothetical protein